MFRLKDKGLSRILITVFTALAVMISFCFGHEDLHQFTASAAGSMDGITGWMDSAIPSPVNEPAVVTKNGTVEFTPLRTGFQRIFMLCGTHGVVSAYYQPSPGVISTIEYIPDVTSTILLKLRI
jgi:hypothetical protein